MRSTLPAFALIAACASSPPQGDKDDVYGVHTDPDGIFVPTETDPAVVDSDLVDTDDPEFGFDTFDAAETDLDTGDTPPNTTPSFTTIPNIHAGIHTPGQTLRLFDVVVTAQRVCNTAGCPPASNGFTVQDPTVSHDAGLFVFVRDMAVLPEPGDVLTLVGDYSEWPPQNISPSQTQSRLTVHTSLPHTSWTKTGITFVPLPEQLTFDDMLNAAIAEDYESMLVTLNVPTPMSVINYPSNNGQFSVARGPTAPADERHIISSQFLDMRTLYNISPGDTVGNLTGILYHEIVAYKLAPRRRGDTQNYVDN